MNLQKNQYIHFLCLCTYVHVCAHMPFHMYGGQRTVYRNWFFSSMWISGIEYMSSGLETSSINQWFLLKTLEYILEFVLCF